MFVDIQFGGSGIPGSRFPQLTNEDSYQLATTGVQNLRVEIIIGGPPSKAEPDAFDPLSLFRFSTNRNLRAPPYVHTNSRQTTLRPTVFSL